ncbi:MAG: TonB family protein [Candidatus Acidiferrales bacterium]
MLFTLTSPVTAKPREPRFLVEWEPRWHQFRSSWSAYFFGPKAPKKFDARYFRDSWVSRRVAQREIYLSILLHAVIIAIVSLPIWQKIFQVTSHAANAPAVDVTWYQPPRDLPPLIMPGPPAAPSPAGQPSKPLPHRGASALHARQTILSEPLRITHPRQTLIQPRAPAEPPKIIPQLPNIVEWSGSAAQPLRPQYGSSKGTPRARARTFAQTPAPEVSAPQQNASGLNLPAGPASQEPLVPASSASSAHPELNKAAGDAGPAPAMSAQQQNSNGLNLSPAPTTQEPRMPLAVASSAHPQLDKRIANAGTAPEVGETANGRMDSGGIPADSSSNAQPPVPAIPGSSAHPGLNKQAANAGPPPEIDAGADTSGRRIIALSETPGPVQPKVVVPQGNLSARISISPEGTQPGTPSGSTAGQPDAKGGSGGGSEAPGGNSGSGGSKPASGGGGKGATSQPGVTISAGNPANTAPVTGPAVPADSLPASPTPHIVTTLPAISATSAPSSPSNSPASGPAPVNPMKKPSAGMDELGMASSPEQILGDKRIYTVYINMPNLTSAAGSWVLNFAELSEDPSAVAGDLAGPVPVRKVDPRYPTSLIKSHVEGEVVLYAIIRSDGSVDSIQLLRGLDPDLDQNAMEAFTHWKFRPGTRSGVPVDLEAVVHIPFRSSTDY